MRFELILLALLFLKSIYSQESFLRINPQGHQGMIRDIAISNDGKYVVSASFDKSIKKLLIMDTCHSGELDKELVADVNTEKGKIIFRAAGVGVRKAEANGLQVTAKIVKELFSDIRRGTGATVISSAGGVEYAMESASWQNGLFTYCLLDGIKNSEADLNNDNIIMLSELQMYLHKIVKKLSKGKQIPTSRIENISLDFPIK